MRHRSRQEVSEEGLVHVDRPVEIDVAHTLDRLVVQVRGFHERLDDPGDVDHTVDAPVCLDHRPGERLRGGPVGDVDRGDGQPVPGISQFRGLVKTLVAYVDRGQVGDAARRRRPSSRRLRKPLSPRRGPVSRHGLPAGWPSRKPRRAHRHRAGRPPSKSRRPMVAGPCAKPYFSIGAPTRLPHSVHDPS
jgi:hypothetical protein